MHFWAIFTQKKKKKKIATFTRWKTTTPEKVYTSVEDYL